MRRYFSFSRESKLALALGLLAITALACHPATVPAAPSGFYVATVANHLIRGAQPQNQSDLALAVMAGGAPNCVDYRLSNDGEGGVSYAMERAWAAAMGCIFFGHPVGYPITSAQELRDAAESIEIERAGGTTVFIHCKRGIDRTGAVIAAWQLLYTPMSRAQIFHEMNLRRTDVDRAIDIESTAALAEIARRVGK